MIFFIFFSFMDFSRRKIEYIYILVYRVYLKNFFLDKMLSIYKVFNFLLVGKDILFIKWN